MSLAIRYLSTAQVADRLRLSRSQVTRLAANGTLRAMKYGNAWWYEPGAVDRLAAERQAS